MGASGTWLPVGGCEIVGCWRQKLSAASLQLFSLRGKVELSLSTGMALSESEAASGLAHLEHEPVRGRHHMDGSEEESDAVRGKRSTPVALEQWSEEIAWPAPMAAHMS
jgi:hypothetical protein